ncbi:TPA: ead/Ea22-like family protein [Enterobacter hormaechei]|nr:ead/Ea22-like family protein [Enterobacter hormaechei]
MSNIDKRALRGQSVEGSYYLAECGHCGEMYPSNKLIESRNYMDGDADCYCPHCNADDCDISDMGSAASEAWNYQQKRIEALLDELEAKDKQIADLKEAFRIALSAAGIDAPAAAGKGEAS